MRKTISYIYALTIPSAIIMVSAIVGLTSISQKTHAKVADYAVTDAITAKQVDRVTTLENFFRKYNSPLVGHAETFVRVADKYDIEYTILPAISCMESTCGKFIPPNTYNPFGWGIYGSNFIAFEDFDEAIETVGEGLNKGYFSKGLDTLPKIAPVYTPPNHRNWLHGVTFFVEQINKEEVALNIVSSSAIAIS